MPFLKRVEVDKLVFLFSMIDSISESKISFTFLIPELLKRIGRFHDFKKFLKPMSQTVVMKYRHVSKEAFKKLDAVK